MFSNVKRREDRSFFYTAVISVSLHVLVLGACFLFITNPFAGRKTAVSLPAIRATLVSMTDLQWVRPTASKPDRQVMRKPEQETPAAPPQRVAVAAEPSTERSQNVTALLGITSRDDRSMKGSFGRPASLSGGAASQVIGKASASGGGHAAESGASSSSLPRYRSTPRPIYPAYARERGLEGVVLVTTEVLVNGQVGQVRIKRSSGYALLDQSALEAVKSWRFIPAKKVNAPIVSYVDIPIRFSLSHAD